MTFFDTPGGLIYKNESGVRKMIIGKVHVES